jgi:hypothetical protein
MPDYQTSKLYRLISENMPGTCYIGSTTRTLAQRKAEHVSRSKPHTKTNHCTSKIIIDAGDYDIFLIEDFPCDRKEQLKARERFHVEVNECVNKNIPGRTPAEYLVQYYQDNKLKFKQYYQDNKPKFKQYYQDNKNKISKPIECTICGCTVRTDNLPKHQRTKKCKRAKAQKQVNTSTAQQQINTTTVQISPTFE